MWLVNSHEQKIDSHGSLQIPYGQLSVSFRWIWYAAGAVAVTYLAFQKHWLPDPIARVVSKVFFYPTFPITALLRLGNYWTRVDDTLLVGCAPMDILDHPAILKRLGVSYVINMCLEYPGPTKAYEKLGIEQLYLPTLDHTEVPVEYILQAVKLISAAKLAGKKVLVHCKAGNGRAASVALSWMMHENLDKNPQELNELLLRKRKVRAKMFKQRNILDYDKIRRKL
eukprot:gene2220-2424_t